MNIVKNYAHRNNIQADIQHVHVYVRQYNYVFFGLYKLNAHSNTSIYLVSLYISFILCGFLEYQHQQNKMIHVRARTT